MLGLLALNRLDKETWKRNFLSIMPMSKNCKVQGKELLEALPMDGKDMLKLI